MFSVAVSAIAMLLATCALLSRACPLSSPIEDCQNECEPYTNATSLSTPKTLNVIARLSSLTNNKEDFYYTNGNLILRDETTDNQNIACYARKNGNKGCVHNLRTDANLQCPWTYQCDYDKNRIPQYLWKADCNHTTSETIYYPVPVLKRDSCSQQSDWELVIEKVPVACACN